MNGGLDTPRCGQPIRYYSAPDRYDYPFPVCFRRKGHPGDGHLSRWAYLRKLARYRRYAERRAAA